MTPKVAVVWLLAVLMPVMSTEACMPIWDFNPDQLEQLERAQIVLYGKEVTRPEPCSDRDPGLCVRRRVQFHVYCVLKSSPAYTINEYITIGTRDDVNSCDQTLFSYDDRQRMWVVMLRHDGRGLEWDELGMRGPAKIYAETLSSPVWSDVQTACGLGSWTPPRHFHTNRCPVLNSTQAYRDDPTCNLRCPRTWYKEGSKCYGVGLVPKSYADAEGACRGLDGELVANLGGAELALIQGRLRPATRYWTKKSQDSENQTMDKDGVSMRADGDSYPELCVGDARVHSRLTSLVTDAMASSLTVTFSTREFKQDFCCKTRSAPGKNIEISSPGSAYWAVLFRAVPKVYLSNLASAAGNKKYSVVFANVLGRDLDLGTMTEPYIQWLVVDVPFDASEGYLEVAKGKTLIKYRNPLPEMTEETYVVFVYEQSSGGVLSDLELYSDNKDGRSLSLVIFQQANGLHLVAGTWFQISWDDYVLCHVIAIDKSRETELCTQAWPDLKTYVTDGRLRCRRVIKMAEGGEPGTSHSRLTLVLSAVSVLVMVFPLAA